MTRKSAPCSSKWVAKLCRSMCGVAFRPIPARRTLCFILNQRVTAANGVPRLVKKTVPGDLAVTSFGRPASWYRCKASIALLPTGTTRSLLPLTRVRGSSPLGCICASFSGVSGALTRRWWPTLQTPPSGRRLRWRVRALDTPSAQANARTIRPPAGRARTGIAARPR